MGDQLSRWMRYINARPFFVLLGGASIAQLISFVGAPLLTRLYSPDAFGLLALFSTALGLAGAIGGGRYEQAIIGEKDDKFASGLVVIVAILSTIFAVVLPFALPAIFPLFDLPSHVHEATVYLAPAMLAYCLGQALTNWLIREGGFSITSGAKVVQAVAVLLISLSLAGTNRGLVFAGATGYVLSCAALAVGALRKGWLNGFITFGEFIFLLRRHVKFPLIGMLPALFDTLSMLLPVYWVAIYFNTTDTGHFGLSRQILAAPLGMLSLVVSQLLMKRLADANTKHSSMVPAMQRVLMISLGPVLTLGLVISMLGPDLFGFLFGESWRRAGAISTWLVWAYAAAMLVSPLSSVLIVLRKIGANGMWQMLHCFGMLAIVSFGNFSNLEKFVQALVIFEVISYALYALLISRTLYIYEKNRGPL